MGVCGGVVGEYPIEMGGLNGGKAPEETPLGWCRGATKETTATRCQSTAVGGQPMAAGG